MPPMKFEASNGKVDFGKTLETATERQKDYLGELLSLSQKVNPNDLKRIPLMGKPDALQRALLHFKDSPEPVHAMHLSVRSLVPQINHFKKILFDTNKDRFPDDLSGFYKTLRDHEGVFFGEMVTNVVNDLYTVQPRETYSITSQILYMQALSQVLFERVKPQSPLDEAVLKFATFDGNKVAARKILGNENRMVRLERMLKEDFDFLATMQISSNYVQRGLKESGAEHEKHHFEWPYPPAGTNINWIGAPGKKTTAIYDVPGLRLVTDYYNKLPKETRDDLIYKHGDVLTNIMFLEHQVLLNAAWSEMRGTFFNAENVASLDAVPEVRWESLHLAREVPSCQKVFFENNGQPFLVTVDPTYDKAYLAAISVTDLRTYMELERNLQSPEKARATISPLSRPFVKRSFSNAESLSFLIRKSDGQLTTYGDTNSLPRAQLGEHYARFENFAHMIVKNLCHTDYIPGTGELTNQPPPGLGVLGPPEVKTIPDEPALRTVPSESEEGDGQSRAFKGRRAHTRLLPSGWMPGLDAWHRARASEAMDLYAEVFDESGKNVIESFKLELTGNDFQKFRNDLLGLQIKHEGNIRFETFVSQAPPNNKVLG
ncbi:hypothetical protein EXS56_02770 [Candidatus Kaiserbacteria bacterium]|nr:hypothetical protein [Candidatus Kaiserbacteria bacterium]